MTKREALLTAAVSSLMTMGALTMSSVASAQDAPEMEKCYGVVKAGKNDCAGAGHTCQGQAKTDASGQEFLMVPAGTCERLVNGSTTAKTS